MTIRRVWWAWIFGVVLTVAASACSGPSTVEPFRLTAYDETTCEATIESSSAGWCLGGATLDTGFFLWVDGRECRTPDEPCPDAEGLEPFGKQTFPVSGCREPGSIEKQDVNCCPGPWTCLRGTDDGVCSLVCDETE